MNAPRLFGQGPGPADLARGLLFSNLLLCPLLFSRQTLEAFEYPKALLLRAVAIVFACLGLGRAVLALWQPGAQARLGRGARALLRDPLALGVLLFLASAALSTWRSLSPSTSFFGAEESYFGLLTMLSYGVLFFATRALCLRAAHARDLLVATALAALLSGAYALAQGLRLDPLSWQGTHAFLGVERAFATFGNPTFLGGFMAAVLPLLGYLALRAARCGPRATLVLWGPAIALALIALGFTLGRGPWLAALCGASVFAAGLLRGAASARARRRLLLAGAGLLALGLCTVAYSPRARGVLDAMLQRVLLTVQTQSQARPEAGLSFREEPRPALWRVAFAMFRAQPLSGVGLDAFQLGYLQQRSVAIWRVEGNRTPQRAHNEVLNVLATQGLPGGAALALVAFGVLVALGRAARRHPDEVELLVAIAAALVATAVHVSFSLTTAPLGLLSVTLLAALAGLQRPPATDVAGPHARTRAGTVVLLACLPAVALLFFGVARPLQADLLARAGVLMEAARPGASIVALGRAVQLDPLRDRLWARLGVAFVNGAERLRGTRERAAWLAHGRRSFEQAVALVPLNSYHHMARARVLLQQALETPGTLAPADCLAAYAQLLTLDPNNPFMYAEAGRAALELQDEPQLVAWSTRCLEIDKDYGACQWLAGRLELQKALAQPATSGERKPMFARAGEHLKAAVLARWYGEDRAQAVAATQAAAALMMADRLAEGVSLAETSVQKDPAYADARYNLGKGYERQGRLAEAAAQYREALRLAPGHAESQRALEELSRPNSPSPR